MSGNILGCVPSFSVPNSCWDPSKKRRQVLPQKKTWHKGLLCVSSISPQGLLPVSAMSASREGCKPAPTNPTSQACPRLLREICSACAGTKRPTPSQGPQWDGWGGVVILRILQNQHFKISAGELSAFNGFLDFNFPKRVIEATLSAHSLWCS